MENSPVRETGVITCKMPHSYVANSESSISAASSLKKLKSCTGQGCVAKYVVRSSSYDSYANKTDLLSHGLHENTTYSSTVAWNEPLSIKRESLQTPQFSLRQASQELAEPCLRTQTDSSSETKFAGYKSKRKSASRNRKPHCSAPLNLVNNIKQETSSGTDDDEIDHLCQFSEAEVDGNERNESRDFIQSSSHNKKSDQCTEVMEKDIASEHVKLESNTPVDSLYYEGWENTELLPVTVPFKNTGGLGKKKKCYDICFKLEVIEYAKTHNKSVTARHFQLARKQVADWLKLEDKYRTHVQSGVAKRRLRGAGRIFNSDFEQNMRKWILTQKDKGVDVTARNIRDHALHLKYVSGDWMFQASSGWICKFVQRHRDILDFKRRHSVKANLLANVRKAVDVVDKRITSLSIGNCEQLMDGDSVTSSDNCVVTTHSAAHHSIVSEYDSRIESERLVNTVDDRLFSLTKAESQTRSDSSAIGLYTPCSQSEDSSQMNQLNSVEAPSNKTNALCTQIKTDPSNNLDRLHPESSQTFLLNADMRQKTHLQNDFSPQIETEYSGYNNRNKYSLAFKVMVVDFSKIHGVCQTMRVYKLKENRVRYWRKTEHRIRKKFRTETCSSSLIKDVQDTQMRNHCKNESSQGNAEMEHLMSVEATRDGQYFIYKCKVCMEIFNQFEAIYSHVMRHEASEYHICASCKEVFLLHRDFADHQTHCAQEVCTKRELDSQNVCETNDKSNPPVEFIRQAANTCNQNQTDEIADDVTLSNFKTKHKIDLKIEDSRSETSPTSDSKTMATPICGIYSKTSEHRASPHFEVIERLSGKHPLFPGRLELPTDNHTSLLHDILPPASDNFFSLSGNGRHFPAGSNNNKIRNNKYTFEFKQEVVDFVNSGETKMAATRKYGISAKRIRDWLAQVEDIRYMVKTSPLRCKIESGRKCFSEKLECDLSEWVRLQQNKGAHVTKAIIKHKVQYFIKNDTQIKLEVDRTGFKASNGWMNRFLIRRGLNVGKQTVCGS